MRRLLTPPWLVLHFFAVVLTSGFVLLGWWQLGRAQGGSAISWGYAFEWPLFALFTVALWIRQMRLELRKEGPETPRRRDEPPPMTSPFEDSIMKARRNDAESSMKARRNDAESSMKARRNDAESSMQTHGNDAEVNTQTRGNDAESDGLEAAQSEPDPNQGRTL